MRTKRTGGCEESGKGREHADADQRATTPHQRNARGSNTNEPAIYRHTRRPTRTKNGARLRDRVASRRVATRAQRCIRRARGRAPKTAGTLVCRPPNSPYYHSSPRRKVNKGYANTNVVPPARLRNPLAASQTTGRVGVLYGTARVVPCAPSVLEMTSQSCVGSARRVSCFTGLAIHQASSTRPPARTGTSAC